MNDVYIKATDLNRWIVKHLPSNQDIYSINDLIGAIEDLDGEIENLNEEIMRLKEYLGYDECSKNDYYNEERDREIEVLGNE